MALEITYYADCDQATGQVYGTIMFRESVSLTGSSASIGEKPDGCAFARFTAGENCRISNAGDADAKGQYLASGAVIDLEAPRSGNYYGRTA